MKLCCGWSAAGILVGLLSSAAFAGSDYIGYSGAPGTPGACAATCHGTLDGSITVSGFPLEYVPGQAYTIWLGHDSGPAIWNFNASVRVGTGSQIAGVISAGLYTTPYSVPTESVGVHLSTYDHDTCSFVWTAPDSGVGDVRLYVAGHQNHTNGPNTTLVLVSGQASAVGQPARALPLVRFVVEPAIAVGPVRFCLSKSEPGPAVITVTDAGGRVAARFRTDQGDAGELVLLWPARDQQGRRLPAGAYIARATVGRQSLARRFVLRNR